MINTTIARGLLSDADTALRRSLTARPWWAGPRLVLTLTPLVGLATGSFSVDSPGRALLMVYAALKMPLLILGTTALCLPGFFVLHAALGVREDFSIALRSVLGGQAVLAAALAALAPLIPVWYTMIHGKRAALMGVSLLFAVSSLASVVSVARVYRRELPRRRAHRVLPACWFLLYAFVGVQMGWMLRPFVGSPEAPPRFLRDEPFTNGYVVVFELLFGGR